MNDKRKGQRQNFNFGDIVKVKGYENELFQIACFTSVYYHYPDALYKEYTYELSRIPDEDWMEAVEDELTLVCTAEEAQELLKRYQAKKERMQQPNIQQLVDQLLDDHITFMELYGVLKDEDYKTMAYATFTDIKKLLDSSS